MVSSLRFKNYVLGPWFLLRVQGMPFFITRNPFFRDKKCRILTFHNNSRQNAKVLHNCKTNATLNKNACFTESQKQSQRERERERERREPAREPESQRASESAGSLDLLTKPLLGSERRSSAPALYPGLVVSGHILLIQSDPQNVL